MTLIDTVHMVVLQYKRVLKYSNEYVTRITGINCNADFACRYNIPSFFDKSIIVLLIY